MHLMRMGLQIRDVLTCSGVDHWEEGSPILPRVAPRALTVWLPSVESFTSAPVPPDTGEYTPVRRFP